MSRRRDTELGYGDVDVDWDEKYDEAEETIKDIRYRIQDTGCRIEEEKNHASCIAHHASSIRHEMSKEQYMDIVRRAKRVYRCRRYFSDKSFNQGVSRYQKY